MPKGYFGWDLIDGEEGADILKSCLHNLDATENGDRHDYCKGVLVGVVSALCAGGMEWDKALQLAWQLAPKNVPATRIPDGEWWERWRAYAERHGKKDTP